MEIHKRNLMIPLFYLYDVESIKNIIFSNESSEYFKDIYNLKSRIDIYDALKWAEQNPNFRFESVMENAPVVGELKFSNEEVHQYLMNFKTFMEQEEYKLLTEDRELKKPEDYI